MYGMYWKHGKDRIKMSRPSHALAGMFGNVKSKRETPDLPGSPSSRLWSDFLVSLVWS